MSWWWLLGGWLFAAVFVGLLAGRFIRYGRGDGA